MPLRGRSLAEWLAVVSTAPLAFAIAYWLQRHWLPATVSGLLAAGVTLAVYRMVLRTVRNAQRAESAHLGMRRLYELTRRTLDMDLHVGPGAHLAALVHEVFQLDGVAVFDADLQEVYKAGHWNLDPGEMVQNVYHFGTSDDDRATGIGRRVVRLGAVPIGSLVVRGETSPLANNAIAALIAVTFDRYRALANENRIEAERQVEQLRATVLDSLAHDYKTPLTAIRAASSGLSEMGKLSSVQLELVALIDEQAALLADLTTRLLTTARPESDEGENVSAGLSLQMTAESVETLIEDAVDGLSVHAAGTRVAIELPREPLILDCDRRLVGMLLAQYLDNACKYAEFDSTITIRAEKSGDEIVLSVHGFGPVIPMADRERIFDRYYRSSNTSSHTAGTGIGLSIAKRTALAHGGSVWVSSDEVEGTTFYAALPASDSELAPGCESNSESHSGCATRNHSGSRSPAIQHQSPTHHPMGQDLPMGTPTHHPMGQDLPMGTPALERSMS
jgi:two-component system sensor histidine kinase KdpD